MDERRNVYNTYIKTFAEAYMKKVYHRKYYISIFFQVLFTSIFINAVQISRCLSKIQTYIHADSLTLGTMKYYLRAKVLLLYSSRNLCRDVSKLALVFNRAS
jgi:hypothetical protein